jgi:hypothetical protein
MTSKRNEVVAAATAGMLDAVVLHFKGCHAPFVIQRFASTVAPFDVFTTFLFFLLHRRIPNDTRVQIFRLSEEVVRQRPKYDSGF